MNFSALPQNNEKSLKDQIKNHFLSQKTDLSQVAQCERFQKVVPFYVSESTCVCKTHSQNTAFHAFHYKKMSLVKGTVSLTIDLPQSQCSNSRSSMVDRKYKDKN